MSPSEHDDDHDPGDEEPARPVRPGVRLRAPRREYSSRAREAGSRGADGPSARDLEAALTSADGERAVHLVRVRRADERVPARVPSRTVIVFVPTNSTPVNALRDARAPHEEVVLVRAILDDDRVGAAGQRIHPLAGQRSSARSCSRARRFPPASAAPPRRSRRKAGRARPARRGRLWRLRRQVACESLWFQT